MSALIRIIFLGSQWAFGSLLERWFGGDSRNETPGENVIKSIALYGIGAAVFIFLVRMFFGRKKWNAW